MADVSTSLQPINVSWRGVAWRAAIIVSLPAAVVLADYLGVIKGDTSALLHAAVLVAVIAIVAIDAVNRKSQAAIYYVLPVALMTSPLLRIEADRTQEVARWRIVLMEACAAADSSSEFAARCEEARVRIDYEPCDFGTSAEQCRREFHRDANWLLIETPIPPHRYGDMLPLEETPQ
jgi:hypothetical protein